MTQVVIEIPREPFLLKLFEHWQHSPTAKIIRDRRDDDKDFTIGQFLFDIWTVQRDLYASLGEEVKDQLSDPDAEVFVAIVAPGRYRYCVLLLAVYYLGPTAMPLSPNILPEEAKYFWDTSNARVVLTASIGDTICTAYNVRKPTFKETQRPPELPKFVLAAEKIPINSDKAFIVLYTSGTTGFSKSVVHSRHTAYTAVQAHVESFRLTRDDLWLFYEDMHYVSGLILCITSILAGACVEFRDTTSNNEDRLERIQHGDGTCIILLPNRLYPIKEIQDTMQDMEGSSGVRYKAIMAGIRRVRLILTGSDQVSPWIRDIWADICGRRPLFAMYTSTEMMGPVASTGFADANMNVPLV